MRKSTFLWLVLAAFCGTALFHTSQKVHDERNRLAALNTSIAHEKESIRVLNAEWSYLNNPQRLETLAKTYLHMEPLTGTQFIKVEDIPLRSAAPPAPTITAEKPAVIKEHPHRLAAVERPVTIRIHKPAAPVYFKKRHRRKGNGLEGGGTTTARNFGDVIKSLGVE